MDQEAKKDAFAKLARETMLSEELDKMEAFLLSYPLFLTEKAQLGDMWMSLYDEELHSPQQHNHEQEQEHTPSRRLLDFLQLWVGIYPKDFDDSMRFQLYQRITARENRAVVNRFKLLLFHSFSTKPGTTPLASTFTVERQTTKRPFHSFTSSIPKSITKEGDGASAAPFFSTAEEEEPTASPRLGSQEEKNAGEIEILRLAESEEATNNDQAAVGPNLQDPLSSTITAGLESGTSNNEGLVAEASGSNGGNRGSKIRYRVKAISLDFMGRNDVVKTKAKSILDYSSLVIAKELTREEYRLFCSVESREFLGQGWQKKEKHELSPNLTLMIERFNRIGYWVATEVLSVTEHRLRVRVLHKFIKVAHRLYTFNNYNGLMQILSGLNNSSVKRLKDTWESLGEKATKMIQDMEKLMEPQSNFKNYRTSLIQNRYSEHSPQNQGNNNSLAEGISSTFSSFGSPASPRAIFYSWMNHSHSPSSPRSSSSNSTCLTLRHANEGPVEKKREGTRSSSFSSSTSWKKPSIPYVGLYLRYLTYLDENSAFISPKKQTDCDGKNECVEDQIAVNTNLMRQRWDQVREFISYQTPPYRIPKNEAFSSYLANAHIISDDEVLYALSLVSQPSPRRDQNTAMGNREEELTKTQNPVYNIRLPQRERSFSTTKKENSLAETDQTTASLSNLGRLSSEAIPISTREGSDQLENAASKVSKLRQSHKEVKQTNKVEVLRQQQFSKPLPSLPKSHLPDSTQEPSASAVDSFSDQIEQQIESLELVLPKMMQQRADGTDSDIQFLRTNKSWSRS